MRVQAVPLDSAIAARAVLIITVSALDSWIRPPWISPLTALVWYFDADAVARAKPYYSEALGTRTVAEMASVIESTRSRLGVQPHEAIPI